ncbi:tetratricopeptide repeat protein [Roseivirga sp.]|uniref:tetratricopeptide repeat protein n=1 Tax=Roseivirga sp. TaxID=1964215 RepID=UPI003B519EDC
MKKLVLIIGIIVAGFSLQAQNQQAYINAMAKGLSSLGSAQSLEEFQSVAGQFERIAANVQDQWHPQYYAALTYINMSFRVEGIDKKDQLTDQAQPFIDKALALSPNNAEIIALQGYKYMIELSADPSTRGQLLSQKAMQQFGKALTIDPNNPRANTFLAQMEMGMAQFFGSPTDKACERAQQALDQFDGQSEEQSFDPKWGKEMVAGLIQQCGQ